MDLDLFLVKAVSTLLFLLCHLFSMLIGRFGGTPLHHAAKRGLKRTLELLLSNGANALLINDDCQTPLEIARAKGFGEIVRALESHICLFAGWLRERYGPGFLETFAPQLLTRKVHLRSEDQGNEKFLVNRRTVKVAILGVGGEACLFNKKWRLSKENNWVVVVPCGSRNLKKPFKLELAIYATLQDAKPRTTIALWKAHMDETAVGHQDPSVTISEITTMSPRRRRRRGQPRVIRQIGVKLLPASEGDKQQLQQFCSACKGIPQVAHSTFPFNAHTPDASAPAPAPLVSEDAQLAMAINASIQSAIEEGLPINRFEPLSGVNPSIAGSSSGTADQASFGSPGVPSKGSSNKWQGHEAGPSGASATAEVISPATSASPVVPSAPIITDEVMDDGPIHYPSIDLDEINMPEPVGDYMGTLDGGRKVDGSSSCVICLDALVEGACVPCGHLAGCMSCLNEVKAKEWGCPICRAKIDQVIRVYAV
ncbi:putative E3 ubiquitin-protein ligase XBAT35 [Drosera capensis]